MSAGLGSVRRAARSYGADPLLRQSLLMLVATAVSAGSGFVFWVAAARTARAEAVGIAAGYMAAVAFLSYATGFSLPYALLRFAGRPEHRHAVGAALLVSAITSAVAAVVYAGGAHVWAKSLTGVLHGGPMLLLFVAVNVSVGVGLLLDSVFAASRAARLAVVRAVVIASRLLLVVLVAGGARSLAAAAAVPYLVALAVALVLLRTSLHFRLTVRWDASTHQLFSFAAKTFPATLLEGAPFFVMPLVVLNVRGARETAFFYVAWNVMFVLQLASSVIAQLALSEGAARGANVAAGSLWLSLGITVPAVAVIMASASVLLRLYGPVYAQFASVPLRVFAVSAIPSCILSTTAAVLRLGGRHRAMTLLSVTSCSLSLGLATLGAARMGLVGVAAGWTAGVALAGVLAAWLLTSPAASVIKFVDVPIGQSPPQSPRSPI